MSVSEFKASELKFLGKFALGVFKLFGLLHREDYEKDGERFELFSFSSISRLQLDSRKQLDDHQLDVEVRWSDARAKSHQHLASHSGPFLLGLNSW